MLRDLSFAQILVAILGIGFLIAWHELGHYAVARVLGMRVLKYSLGFGPRLFGFRRGEIDYQVAALPLGGFVQIAGMTPLEEGAADDPKSFINAPRWARFLVLAAGPGFNYVAAAVLFFMFFWMWPSPVATAALELVEVHPGPAAEAGLVSGEYITAVDGTVVENDAGFRAAIAASNGNALRLDVVNVQGGHAVTRTVDVTPRREENGALRLGVSPSLRYPRQSFVGTVASSALACVNESIRTLQAFGALARREPGVDVGSPVAIVADMKDKIARGVRYFVMMLAVLSVNLGLLNLLPVPSLDGIKMAFLAVESALRRDLNAAMQMYVNAAGLLALLVLMFGLMLRDTVRLLG